MNWRAANKSNACKRRSAMSGCSKKCGSAALKSTPTPLIANWKTWPPKASWQPGRGSLP